MLERAADDWEREQLAGFQGDVEGLGGRVDGEASGAEPTKGRGARGDLFPLAPFLQEDGDGPEGGERRRRALPELLREELLHRFVAGE